MADLVVHPSPTAAHIAYLASVTEITALVGGRIRIELPSVDESPRWPALRVTTLDAPVLTGRRWVRAYTQVDCYAATQDAADGLAALVVAALTEAANHTTDEAVLGGPEPRTLTTRSLPDRTLTPAQPRTIVTGQLWIRPNP